MINSIATPENFKLFAKTEEKIMATKTQLRVVRKISHEERIATIDILQYREVTLMTKDEKIITEWRDVPIINEVDL